MVQLEKISNSNRNHLGSEKLIKMESSSKKLNNQIMEIELKLNANSSTSGQK